MGGAFIPDEIPEKIHIIISGCHVNHQSMNDLMSIDFLIPFEPVIGGVKCFTASFTPILTDAESRGLEPQCYHPLVFETRTITLMVLLSLFLILLLICGLEEFPQRINIFSPEPLK
jgi:hypothetical protein